MEYLDITKKTALLNFLKFNKRTSGKVGEIVAIEIIDFLNKNKKGKVIFQFPGYAMYLNKRFYSKLFTNEILKHDSKIEFNGIHIFDQTKIQEFL